MPYALMASILLLALGPLLGHRLSGGRLRAGADGFVLVAVLGLIILTLMPEALMHAGPFALVAAGLAFALPWFAERQWHRFEMTTHKALLIVSGSALALHGVADGAVLHAASHSPSHSQDGPIIIWGLLLHRAGASLALWWLMVSTLGRPVSLLVMVGFALSTSLGYFVGGLAEELSHSAFVGLWQAVAAGSLLHVVMHPLGPGVLDSPAARMSHRIGTLLAFGVIAGLMAAHGGHEGDHTSGLEALMTAGIQAGPLLLGVMIAASGAALIWGPVNTQGQVRSAINVGGRASALLWLGLGLITADPSFGLFEPAPLVFALWGGLLLGILAFEGARGFVGGRRRAHRCGHTQPNQP